MSHNEKPQIGKIALYGVMAGMLLTGSANTLIMKWQDDTKTTNTYIDG